MILVELADFASGKYKIATTNVTETDLQDYIDRYEKPYIYKIFGVELGQLIIDDINGGSTSDPIEQRLQNLIDSFVLQANSCWPFTRKVYESLGLKDILKAAIYFHYVKEDQSKHSQSGVTQGDAEVSKVSTVRTAVAFAEKRWNEALGSVEAIQWRCRHYEASEYPEYAGVYLPPQYGSYT